MRKSLAIVIPAYKVSFLAETLKSIAAQSCQDFIVYIGDDHSPFDIKSIVDKYINDLNIVYRRFETNLGGKDLVAQWTRCIDMTQGEDWIWLFSDDDIMEPNCVERFLETIINDKCGHEVYHFDIKIIDEKGCVVATPKPYPQVLASYDYYKGKMEGRFMSMVVENVFSRDVYDRYGGFKNFDLAWGSDTATWTIFSVEKDMYSIQGAKVLWRRSSENISPDNSRGMVIRKVRALNDFLSWSYGFFNERSMSCKLLNAKAFVQRMKHFKKYLSRAEITNAVDIFCENNQCTHFKFLIRQGLSLLA